MLNAETLAGVWALVPTPRDQDDKPDEASKPKVPVQVCCGASDAAVNKADAAVNIQIRCGLRVRGPYTSCRQEDVDRARRWAQENFPELLTS